MELISKEELIERIKDARAESHKEAKGLEEHYIINSCTDSFLRILNACRVIEASNERE